MIEGLAITLLGFFGNFWGGSGVQVPEVPIIAWEQAAIFQLPTQDDPGVTAIVQQYLQELAVLGIDPVSQGVWIQSDWAVLGEHNGKTPASAASLTKIATSLAALQRWGPEHRFETRLYAPGPVAAGVLKGDLWVVGGGDPLFVWEEAIALGNQLNRLGIREIAGNLRIVGDFVMNFQPDSLVSGQLLRQALDQSLWTPEIMGQHQGMAPGTDRPSVRLLGKVELALGVPESAQPLLRHQSLTVAQLLKQMNLYSNNVMAEMLAESVGGAGTVASLAAEAARVPVEEIQLVNGSGLGVDNRISPRASVKMLMAIEESLQDQPVKLNDVFPVAGRDRKGTLRGRQIPSGVAIKTGTLNLVSALAGTVPTQERETVWFALINYNGNVLEFRAAQDRLLQRLARHWTVIPAIDLGSDGQLLGDPRRIVRETDG
ncbi:MAG: D-alanyl-D-alanine carboxypeptidase [Chloroflexaceae bacterium]|nr:D-alanyl-D-alanine carboxypeptidase [Chloroflexaceae bacterium]